MKSLTEQQLRDLLNKAWVEGWVNRSNTQTTKEADHAVEIKEIFFTNLINQV